jgi:hypothetical protein
MNDTISYNEYIDHSEDDRVWKPISPDERPFFLSLIDKVRTSFENGTKKEKGDAMEELMTFIYNRFKAIKVYHNVFKSDNQIDHIVEFIDGMAPTFIHCNVGLRIIGESKNHKKSIGPREVANLDELLRDKGSKLGIFSSFKSFSKGKSMWTLGEGKRRKLAIAYDRKIIGFTIDELESLTENNFYTMIKQKYNRLVDEIEDDYEQGDCKLPYQDSLYCSLKQLHNLGIIDDVAFDNGVSIIERKYGSINKEL